MRQISFLIKPASSLCNFRCRYCFYEDESEHRTVKSFGVMAEDTAEKLISAACAELERGGELLFAFQGGEPTVAGLPFFRRFIELVRQYASPKIRVGYSIQTNGSLLDEEWARFFAENRFLVGLSVDGGKELHDLYRVDAENKGTWSKVVSSLRLLQRYGVAVNLLCVVTKQCAKKPQTVYNSLKKLGVRHIQFIPCLDPLDAPRLSAPYSLSADDYGSFLIRLFDLWYQDWKTGNYVSVRLFDDYVHILAGQPVSACTASGHCGRYLVVESDGSLYPCDFYVLDSWKLGNIRTSTVSELDACDLARRFREEGERRPGACRSCEWYPICRGGCKRDWQTKDGALQNTYCTAFRRFFAHSISRLEEIAAAERRYGEDVGKP